MDEISESVYSALNVDLAKRVKERKDRIVASLMDWLANETIIKRSSATEAKVAEMQQRVNRMVEDLKVKIVHGKITVEINPSDEDTLKMFRLGTSWFAPHENVTEQIVAGLFDEK